MAFPLVSLEFTVPPGAMSVDRSLRTHLADLDARDVDLDGG
ncbi:MAG TPA: hypothetical protein VFY82_06190 [Acidimicrobiales bacterium]|nr:hypothetical protein [Acidimicrobiales bacterium]